MLTAALAITPVAATCILLFLCGRSAAFTGFAAWGLALGLALVTPGFSIGHEALQTACIKGLLVCLTAGYVVFFGTALFHLMESAHIVETVGNAVQRLTALPVHQALLLVVGFSPLIESSAGFSTAVIVLLPLLRALGFDSVKAALLALVSLTAVPWGAMGTGTVIGAGLAGIPVRDISMLSALMSVPTFVYFTLVIPCIIGGLSAFQRHWPESLLVACALAGSVLFFSAVAAVEVVGVAASLSTLAIALPLLLWRGKKHEQEPGKTNAVRLDVKALLKGMSPYLVLAVLLFLSRSADWIGTQLTAYGGLVLPRYAYTFYPMYSPGFFLALTAAYVLCVFNPGCRAAKEAFAGSFAQTAKFCLATLPFVGMSETMLASGMTEALVQIVPKANDIAAISTCVFIGAAGGFFTGSNTGSNAMFMSMQIHLAHEVGTLPPLAAALQNTAASHMTMASPSRITLVDGAGLSKGHMKKLALRLLCIALGAEALMAVCVLVWRKYAG